MLLGSLQSEIFLFNSYEKFLHMHVRQLKYGKYITSFFTQ